ncbi:MTR2 [Candida oxycetoniae]|uniref:MTR2 n=1 Tax=Candida oxycetoniae TaxID=497107 RepID=A0AAI9WXT2_9ASCO|nr:MTR2 [Candida oxycetoniae]KAI3404319.2 MTR2 [Candida oxycetoniae]
MNQDPKPFLKNLLSSLDASYHAPTQSFTNVEAYATQFGSGLKRSCAIIINGQPIIPSPTEDSKLQFQKKWLATPISSHQLTSYDGHLIPSTNMFIINFSAKVKFDQSGKNRLGESADLVQENTLVKNARPLWGSWFGVNVNLVVDNNFTAGGEIINSMDYRFTYVPKDTVLKV